MMAAFERLSNASNGARASIEPNASTPSTKSKTVDEELADMLKAQKKRRNEMITSTRTSFGRLWKTIRTDHNTTRLALVCLTLMCSFFSSIVIVLAGANPPRQYAVYEYNDLMRLVTKIHEKSLEVTPNLPRKEWEAEMLNTNGTHPTQSSSLNLARELPEWWPIRSIEFESEDAILNDFNYYSRNYATFHKAFIVLLTMADAILLLTWFYFLAVKELKIYKHKNRLVENGSSSQQANLPGALYEKVKRLFKGKPLKTLKRSWFDDAPRSPWDKTSFVLILCAICFLLIMFTILMARPSMLTLVLHQADLVCLSVVCLASTELKSKTPRQVAIREEPRSLRTRTNSQSPALQVAVEPTGVVGSTDRQSQSVFVTDESIKAGSINKNNPQVQYPNGNNPFGEEEEAEEEGNEKRIDQQKSHERDASIDEDVERDAEQTSAFRKLIGRV